jgi:hypothetical protein
VSDTSFAGVADPLPAMFRGMHDCTFQDKIGAVLSASHCLIMSVCEIQGQFCLSSSSALQCMHGRGAPREQ